MPAVDGGEEAAQLYVGRETNFTTAHPLKDLTEESILATMQDRVNYHGALESLAANNASVYCGPQVPQVSA